MFILFLLAFLAYALVLTLPYRSDPPDSLQATFPAVTLIVPTRNLRTLPDLIKRLDNIDYNGELSIIISINGIDSRPNITPVKGIQIIHDKKASKKRAIHKAIQMAKTEWIVTMDDDILCSSDTLNQIVPYHATGDVVTSPVKYLPNNGATGVFSIIENWALQALTYRYIKHGKPIMANGAVLAFSKSAYELTEVYSKYSHWESGDDTFLVQLAVQNNLTVTSSHSVIETHSPDGWGKLIQQRRRWLAKSKSYPSLLAKIVTVIIGLTNLLTAYAYIQLLINPNSWYLIIIGMKFLIDLNAVLPIAIDFSQRKYLWFTPIFAIIYPFYSLMIAVLSLFQPKDRW